jgi:hypothetical protein
MLGNHRLNTTYVTHWDHKTLNEFHTGGLSHTRPGTPSDLTVFIHVTPVHRLLPNWRTPSSFPFDSLHHDTRVGGDTLLAHVSRCQVVQGFM